MKNEELINQLQQYPKDAEVRLLHVVDDFGGVGSNIHNPDTVGACIDEDLGIVVASQSGMDLMKEIKK